MTWRVDVIINPVCLRFRLFEGEVVYLFGAHSDMQLDKMERMLGISPAESALFDSNLGFLPVASTVLIRGERNILVDPGNHHIGGYGLLQMALAPYGLAYENIDIVVATHSHHDHMASIRKFPGKQLIIGEHELDYARAAYGPEIDAVVGTMGSVREVPAGGEPIQLLQGIHALHTPGHTPGSISLVVETDEGPVAIVGDCTMTQSEWNSRQFSHWYTDAQLADLNGSVERISRFRPVRVIPGHDRAFESAK